VLAKALNDGKPVHHSVIVRGRQRIITWKTSRGARLPLAISIPQPAISCPRAMLLSAGIDVKDLLYYNIYLDIRKR